MLSFERLKELKSWVSDLRKFGVSEGNEIIVLIDETIAHQSVTEMAVCPNCNGCGYEFNSELINEYEITHCPKCGEEIEESIDLGW